MYPVVAQGPTGAGRMAHCMQRVLDMTRRHWYERSEERHRQHVSATYQAFIDDIVRLHPMPRDRAESAAVSVLSQLERRVTPGEAHHLSAQLPWRLRVVLSEFA